MCYAAATATVTLRAFSPFVSAVGQGGGEATVETRAGAGGNRCSRRGIPSPNLLLPVSLPSPLPPPLFPPACSLAGASLEPKTAPFYRISIARLFEEPAACSVVDSCRFMSIYGWRRGGQVKRAGERRDAPQVSSDMELLLRITFVAIKAVLPALFAKLSIRSSLPEQIRCCCCLVVAAIRFQYR